MGRWVRNGPFPLKNDLFLVYSTIAESRAKFDHLGPQKHPVKALSEENQRPRATPKPKLASVWSGQAQLADPNPVVQDWKQPVRAPSEENQRPRHPKPKLATVCSGQVQLADANPMLKHPARAPCEENRRPRATPFKPKLAPVWSGQVQLADPNPIARDWKHPVRSPSEENYRPRATPEPKLTPLVLTSPASRKRDRCKEQLRGQERDQSSREP